MISKISLKILRKSIKKRTQLDIKKLNPIEYIKNCRIPAFFIVGMLDDIVIPTQIIELFEAYPNHIDKRLVKIPNGTHNSARPTELLQEAV